MRKIINSASDIPEWFSLNNYESCNYYQTVHSTGISSRISEKKVQRLFGSVHKGKPGPNGPNKKLINIILELKQRNPEYGCPKIALLGTDKLTYLMM